MPKAKINEKQLIYLYIQSKESARFIGNIMGCSHTTIFHRLKDLNIPLRNHKESAQFNSGCYKAQQIDLKPTAKLGYVCGLILGDGYIIQTKRRNYWIALGTTKEEFRDLFKEAFRRAFPNLHCYTSQRLHKRKFPNGTEREDITYLARIDSKQLYQALRPYKQKDFHWTIPKFLTTKASKIGFLKGIYDAEGSVNKRFVNNKGYGRINLFSKHNQTLIPLIKLLNNLGIYSYVSVLKNNCSVLSIRRKTSKLLFQKLIHFRIPNRKQALDADLKHLECQRLLF